jgi:hypothetical protein
MNNLFWVGLERFSASLLRLLCVRCIARFKCPTCDGVQLSNVVGSACQMVEQNAFHIGDNTVHRQVLHPVSLDNGGICIHENNRYSKHLWLEILCHKLYNIGRSS